MLTQNRSFPDNLLFLEFIQNDDNEQTGHFNLILKYKAYLATKGKFCLYCFHFHQKDHSVCPKKLKDKPFIKCCPKCLKTLKLDEQEHTYIDIIALANGMNDKKRKKVLDRKKMLNH